MMIFTMIGCSNTETKDKSNTVKILCPAGAPSLAFVSEYENISKKGKIDFFEELHLHRINPVRQSDLMLRY